MVTTFLICGAHWLWRELVASTGRHLQKSVNAIVHLNLYSSRCKKEEKRKKKSHPRQSTHVDHGLERSDHRCRIL